MTDNDHDQSHHEESLHDHAHDAIHHSGSSCWSSASEAESHLHQLDHPTSTQIHEVNEAKEHAQEEWAKAHQH